MEDLPQTTAPRDAETTAPAQSNAAVSAPAGAAQLQQNNAAQLQQNDAAQLQQNNAAQLQQNDAAQLAGIGEMDVSAATAQLLRLTEEQANEAELASSAQDVENSEKLFGTKISAPKKLAIAAAVAAAFFISFMLGQFPMTPPEIIQTIAGYFPKMVMNGINSVGNFFLGIFDPSATPFPIDDTLTKQERVLFNIRLPRILLVMFVGASLSVAGAAYQGMFKNPLTSPDLLGASNGAALGACIGLLLGLAGGYVQLFAFLGGILAVALVLLLNKMVDYEPTLSLVLAGILVSSLFSAGMSMIKFMADADDKLPTITFWLMGSFSSVSASDFLVCLAPMLIGFALLISQAWKLNVLSFGDEEARAMGVNTKRVRLLVIAASTLITSASVAVAGVIGWIGLVIPHLSRAIVGPNYKKLLPTSIFVGAVFLLIVDNFARLMATVEIPIGILTAILGVPFFVVIFKRNMKGWR